MSEFLGARISLISKSDIRYVGILHEINSSDSTVSLENVRSFGTEGRKGDPSEEVAPSDQIYEYIVFRGSDVKDLRIEEGPGAVKENKPPAVPNDPAILGARPHPGSGPGPASQQGPPGAPPGGPGFGQNQMFYPPPGAPWGRGGPPPGPGGFGGMGYPPPPPNWFPPGQGFPTGPGPWNNYPYPPGAPGGPPGPPGPPGQNNRQGPGGPAGPGGPQGPNQEARPSPIGPGAEKQKGPAEKSSEPRAPGQASIQQASASAPTPPVQSKPTVEEVKATAASLETNGKSAPSNKAVPTGPRGARITPAVPLPAALTAKVGQQAMNAAAKQAEGNPAAAAASLRDATQAAKAAVAVAMANLNGPAGAAPAGAQHNGNAMDNLTNKVNEMRVNAARSGVPSNRGRGRGGRQAKIEVPDSDFDFASSNAKFNKEDLVKEAIAGSPAPETPDESANEAAELTTGNPAQAYNKTKSFFDNISSEARERAENNGQKPGGREWRGEEQRKNMETFGQGSVDGGYRGYRGRGRGRGGMRGRGYGQGRGRGGYRGPRNDPQQATAEQ